MTLRVLTLSNLYPNRVQPRHGIFTEHRVRHLVQTGQIQAQVVAPVPWFPWKNRCFGRYGVFAQVPRHEERYGIPIEHPRFPVLPKLGTSLSPPLLAAALRAPLARLAHQGFCFDVIDAYYFYPDGVAAVILGKIFHKPVVVTAFGSDISLLSRYYIPSQYIRWAARQAGAVTTVCETLKRRLVELGAPPDRVNVVLHGVDLELFHPPADRHALRTTLGLNGPTLLSVGNLIELKGHHLAIEALTTLRDVTLLIAGSGPFESKLRALARRHNVSDRVRFLGLVSQQQLCDYYGAADALILASSREGVANVLLESMACGTPVVATNVWGSPEVVTDPEAGRLMTTRTVQSLVDTVNALLAAPPDRQATRQFAERFSWDETTRQHLDVLRAAVDRSRSAAP